MADNDFYNYCLNLEHIKYFIFQREKGKEKGTEHFQVFLQFTIGKRFDTIKNLFPKAHIENVKGSNIQARDYCSKNDTRIGEVYEFGDFAEERQRTDITAFYDLIKSGATNSELQVLFPSLFFKFYRNIEMLRQEFVFEEYRTKLRFLEVVYIYGPAGTGKTRYVFEHEKDFYRITNYDNGAFDNYKGQKVLVFDEFSSSYFKITDMNNFLDIYPLDLPSRYFNKVACYEKVYIISNLPLSEHYKNVQENKPELWQAFLRRIHKVLKFDKFGNVFEEEKTTNTKLLPLENLEDFPF